MDLKKGMLLLFEVSLLFMLGEVLVLE